MNFMPFASLSRFSKQNITLVKISLKVKVSKLVFYASALTAHQHFLPVFLSLASIYYITFKIRCQYLLENFFNFFCFIWLFYDLYLFFKTFIHFLIHLNCLFYIHH